MKLKQGFIGASALALAGCGNFPNNYVPPVAGTPLLPVHPSHTPELATIRTISPGEMQKYGGIMTAHLKEKNAEKLMSICHFSRMTIPSTTDQRVQYNRKTGKTWESTGGDVYTVTARHCIDDMGSPAVDKRIDVVAIRSLNRLFATTNIVFRTIDNPPTLERSSYDETTIGDKKLTISACVPNMKNNEAFCFEMSGRTYSRGQYGKRSMFYKISDIVPLLRQAGRTCTNNPHISGTSGMIARDPEGRGYGVISTGMDICKASALGAVNAILDIEPVRNTANSLPGETGKTFLLGN